MAGVSTRRMDKLVKTLGIDSLSPTTCCEGALVGMDRQSARV